MNTLGTDLTFEGPNLKLLGEEFVDWRKPGRSLKARALNGLLLQTVVITGSARSASADGCFLIQAESYQCGPRNRFRSKTSS
jgi:hypothetical protein